MRNGRLSISLTIAMLALALMACGGNSVSGPGTNTACSYASSAARTLNSAQTALVSTKNYLDSPQLIQADIDRLTDDLDRFLDLSVPAGGQTTQEEVKKVVVSAVAYLLELKAGRVGELPAMAYLGNLEYATKGVTRFRTANGCQ